MKIGALILGVVVAVGIVLVRYWVAFIEDAHRDR